jgi:predicted ATP-grasp superfamily ATP-dependent carboligase
MKIDRFEDLPKVADTLDARSWMMCGGLENYPRIVAQVSQNRTYYGPTPESISRVKDPFDLSHFCGNHSVAFPTVQSTLEFDFGKKRWLKKPFKSAGGHDIEFVVPTQAIPRINEPDSYLQELIEGVSVSAVFVSGHHQAVELVGISRQLIGDPALTNCLFAYCGSIGPVRCSAAIQQQILRIGRLVCREYQLVGVVGMDFVVNQNRIYLIEVNPRVTASCELYEMAGIHSSITQLHVSACTGIDIGGLLNNETRPTIGKAIVFSNWARPFEINRRVHQQLIAIRDNATVKSIADIPRIGTVIASGDPIVSVYAYVRPSANRDIASLHQKLVRSASQIKQLISSNLPALQFD